MPTYEYACRSCDRVIEVFQSMRDAPLTNCPECGRPGVKRLIGRGAGIIFKGSGFYETDYRRSSAGNEAGEKKSTGEDSSTPAAAASATGSPTTSSGAATGGPPTAAKTD